MILRYTFSFIKSLFLILIINKSLVFCKDDCWKSYDAAQHFEVMDNLDGIMIIMIVAIS